MSSFEAQAALAGQAQGMRRPGAVQINTQQRVIPVAELTAPPVGSIAPFVAPTLDTKAAQDLEQAMQVVQQTGQAFGQLGQFARFSNAMTEREDIYDGQLRFVNYEAQQRERFAKGDLNGLLDSGTMEDTVATFAQSWQGKTEAGTRYYQMNAAKLGADLYLKRQTERQSQDLSRYASGVIATILNRDTPEQDLLSFEDEYRIASGRFPFLDRDTFTSMVYAPAINKAVELGDQQLFNRASRALTDPVHRTLLVDQMRPKLQHNMMAVESGRRRAVEEVAKQQAISTDPLVVRYQRIADVAVEQYSDPGMREGVMRGWLVDQMESADPASIDAIVMTAERSLSPDSVRMIQNAASARVQPMMLEGLRAAAKNGDMDAYPTIRERSMQIGVGVDDIATADSQYIATVEDNRVNAILTQYAQGTVTRDEIATEVESRLRAFDTNKPAIEQVANAIQQREASKVLQGLDAIDRQRESRMEMAEVLSAPNTRLPGAPIWSDIYRQRGALVGTAIGDPNAAATLALATQTIPTVLLDAIYLGLNSTGMRQDAALQTMSKLAGPMRDQNGRFSGWTIRATDEATNRATFEAINEIRDELISLPRDAAGNLTPESLDYARNRFAIARDNKQDAVIPPSDERKLVDNFNIAGTFQIGDSSLLIGAETSVTSYDRVAAAVRTEMAKALQDAGVPDSALADLSADGGSRIMQRLDSEIPLDRKTIEREIKNEATNIQMTHILPTIGRRVLPAQMEDYPGTQWNETWARGAIADANIAEDRVEHIVPAMGGENRWMVVYTDDDGDRRMRVIQQPQEQAAAVPTPAEIIRNIREAQRKPKTRGWFGGVPQRMMDMSALDEAARR